MRHGGIPFVLLALLAMVAGTATALGRGDAATPARIIFASSASPAFGEHIDIVSVDGRGRPSRVADLGPGTFAAPSPDGRRVAFLRREPRVDGLQLYVMNTDGSEKRQLTAEAPSDLANLPLVWSPGGRFIAFVRLGPTIGIAAADGSSVRYIATESAVSPAWSPDGRTIAYTTQAGGLFLAEADGSGARRIGTGSSAPQWAPGGRRLSVVRAGSIWIVDADTRRATQVEHGVRALEAFTPVWSPGGRRLAFIGSRNTGSVVSTELWTVEPATDRVKKLTGALGGNDVDTPSWSPNGRWLAVAAEGGFLRIVSSERLGTVRALASWPPRRASGPPSWLPDGRVLLSTRVTENDHEIFVANADGSGVRALTENRVPDLRPTGSPDGRRIAYVSVPPGGGKRTIYVMRSDGREKRRLLGPGLASKDAPAWSPGGSEIAFESRGFIYLVAAAGGASRQLVRGSEPAWAPNARTVAFRGTLKGRSGIWLIERDRTGLRPAPGFRLPSVAPDAARLAFQRPVARNANGVFVADLSTGSEQLLVSPGRDPAWSPDGLSIAYDTRDAIWTISSGGGAPTRVTTLNGTTEHASWLPAASP